MHFKNPSEKNRRRDSRDRYKGYPYANKKDARTFRNRQLRRTEHRDIAEGGVRAKPYKNGILWDIW